MNIKRYISRNLDFKYISLIYSDAVIAQRDTLITYSEGSIQKTPAKDSSTFWANSVSDFIFAIEFILTPILILFGIVVGLYHWKRKTSKKYRLQSEVMEANMASENQPIPNPQVEHSEVPRMDEQEYSVEYQNVEEMALNELKNARHFRERGRISEYCTAISWATKKYVGEKYHIKIVGVSTSQILNSLPQELTDSVFDYVGEILRTCDMISLAQHRPSHGELDHIHQIAMEFIQSQIQTNDTEEEEQD